MSRELERERRMAVSRAARADTLREMNVYEGAATQALSEVAEQAVRRAA